MNKPRALRAFSSLAGAGLIAGVAVLALAAPALAAPFADQSSALALNVTVASLATVDSGTQTAVNDGTTATVTVSGSPLLSVLGAQTVVTAGALAETAVANNDGTTAACAGVTGEGGLAQVGSQTTCVTPGTSGVGLALGGLIGVTANAIYATCTSAADGTTAGAGHIANGVVTLAGITVATLDADAAPNTSITPPALSGLVSIVLNKQTLTGGQLTVTALSITALSGTLASVNIGVVSCGPAADLAAVPALPKAGYGVAGGTLAGVALLAFAVRRRRVSAPTA
jgi:hypothetical protein